MQVRFVTAQELRLIQQDRRFVWWAWYVLVGDKAPGEVGCLNGVRYAIKETRGLNGRTQQDG
jgi:hypothetical protein